MGFDLGPWRVDPELNTIVRGDRESHVTPKAMDVLVYLAKKGGQVISREELFREVWAGSVVTEDALTRCIGEIRRALDEDSRNPTFIETVPKRGYRIVAAVVWPPASTGENAGSESVSRRRFWKAVALRCRWAVGLRYGSFGRANRRRAAVATLLRFFLSST